MAEPTETASESADAASEPTSNAGEPKQTKASASGVLKRVKAVALKRSGIVWVAIFAAFAGFLTVGSLDSSGFEADEQRVRRLQESFACPVCRGESVADSDAAVAAQIREFVDESVFEGATDVEIRDALVASYGVNVLQSPPADGIYTFLWVLPVMVFVSGAAGVYSFVISNRGKIGATELGDSDRELVAEALLEYRSRANDDS